LCVAVHAVLRRLPRYRSAWAAPRTLAQPRGLVGLWWCWLVAGVLLSLFGIPGRPWYLAPAVPPLLLLSAHAVHLLFEFSRRVPEPRPAFPVVVAFVWFGAMMIDPLASQRDMALRQYHLRFQDRLDPGNVELIAEIEAHTQPGDAIFLSAYRPEVYWRTRRRLACRYPGTLCAGGWEDPRNPVTPRIAEELRKNKPPLIQWTPLPQEDHAGGAFTAWLHENYRQIDPDVVAGLWLRSDRMQTASPGDKSSQ